jgi:hypothetical protein
LSSTDPTISIGDGYNPTLNLLHNTSYKFDHIGTSHPFKLIIGNFEQIIAPGTAKIITIPSDQNTNPHYLCTLHPASMTNTISLLDTSLPHIEIIGGITTITQNITIPISPSGDDIPQGLSYQITSPVSGASIIGNSSSGYSLQYTPSSSLDPYTTKITIPIRTIGSSGNNGPISYLPIYFYQMDIAFDDNFAPLLEIYPEFLDIPIDEHTGPTHINLNNNLSNSDFVGSSPIRYTISDNTYFSIHPDTGLISLTNNAFPPDLSELTLRVFATSTTNQRIAGVYSDIFVYLYKTLNFADSGNDGIPDAFQDIDGDGTLDGFANYAPGDDVYFNYEGDLAFDENFQAILNDSSREFILDGSETAEYNFDQDTNVKEFKIGDGKIINKKNLKTVEEMIFGNGSTDKTQFDMSEANARIEAGKQLKFGGEGDFTGNIGNGIISALDDLIFADGQGADTDFFFNGSAQMEAQGEAFWGKEGNADLNFGGDAQYTSRDNVFMGFEPGSKADISIIENFVATYEKEFRFGAGDTVLNIDGGTQTYKGEAKFIPSGNGSIKANVKKGKQTFEQPATFGGNFQYIIEDSGIDDQFAELIFEEMIFSGDNDGKFEFGGLNNKITAKSLDLDGQNTFDMKGGTALFNGPIIMDDPDSTAKFFARAGSFDAQSMAITGTKEVEFAGADAEFTGTFDMSGTGNSTLKGSGGTMAMDDFIMGSEHIAEFTGAITNVKDDVSLKGKAKMTISSGGFNAADDVILEGEAKVNASGGTFTAQDLFELKENAEFELNGESAKVILTEVTANPEKFTMKKGEVKMQQFTCNSDKPLTNNGGTINTNTVDDTNSSTSSSHSPNTHPEAIDKLLNQTKIIGSFSQNSGTLAMNISANNNNSKLVVTGQAALGGNLSVTKSSNMVFSLNQTYQLIQANSISGKFSTVSLPELGSGLSWDTSSLYSDGTIKVASGGSTASASNIYTYPNPVLKSNPTAYITYSLPSASNITIEIYDIFGHRVHSTSITSGQTGAVSGANKYTIPSNIINDMSRSVYFAIIHNGSQTLGKTKFAVK